MPPSRPSRIDPVLHNALDTVRAAAAIYVALHHITLSLGLASGLGVVFRFGQEAVMVFFLLSGFVIFANEHERALAPRGYYLRRLRRIYPPLIAAMVLSTLIALYEGNLTALFSWPEFAGTLVSLQDIPFLKPGVIVAPYLGNDPLWSLSYEVFFYLIFPFVLRGWRLAPQLGTHLIGAACCLAYGLFLLAPNHFFLVSAYFLVWWAGAMAAHSALGGAPMMRPVFAWLVVLCAIASVGILVQGYRGIGFYPALMLRHFLIAVAMLAFAFSLRGKLLAQAVFRFRKLAAAAASISYAIYVLHYPLFVKWSVAATPIGFVGGVILLLVLSYLVERQLPKLLPAAPKT